MVLLFSVSVMCSYEPFWRRLGSISAPGGLGGGGGVLVWSEVGLLYPVTVKGGAAEKEPGG